MMPYEANTTEMAPSADRGAARYRALIRLSETIRANPDPKQLFDTLSSELRQIVPFDAIVQFDSAANLIRWDLKEPYKALVDVARLIPKEESVPAWVHANQRPLILRLSEADVRFPRYHLLHEIGLTIVCALPLTTAHRRLGSLVLASHLDEAYSVEDQEFLMLVASQIALAIDDAMNLARLRLLLELTNRLVSNLQLPDLLREISVGVRQVMQCDAVGVVLPDSETGNLSFAAFDFPTRPATGQPPVFEYVKSVFTTGQRAILSTAEIGGDLAPSPGLRTVCAFPLVARDRILGVLALASTRVRAFNEDDLSFIGQVASQTALAVENALHFGKVTQLKDQLASQNVYLESEIRTELHFDEIVGKSKALKRVLAEIETVAPTDSTVLIYGETGTGKELIARAVHNLSLRKAGAFVKLNCAAIPTGLLESELFGHEKGAFTGAITQRIGRFELAHRGTIFLDEVGEIPLELQPKLLRVLQEREYERLGSSRTLRADARLIAATNRDLKAMADEQKFRTDLYYRLNVFPIRVPALRERTEDIPLLVRHFVQEYTRRNNRTIDTILSETMEALIRYPWPGNIRELQNVIERGVILSSGPVLNVRSEDLQAPSESLTLAGPANTPPNPKMRQALEDVERQQIIAALEGSNWVIAGPEGAAVRLGMKRTTLQSRMQKLGIRISRNAN